MAHELLYRDDALQATLFGNLTTVPEPPSRLVNIFVSSTKSDLEYERRQLHEVVVPQLQKECSSLGVDIQLVDIQNGEDDDVILEPTAIAQHLEEIEDCYKTSLGCFFICLIGNKYRPYALPASIDATEYNHIHSAASEAGLDASLLDNHYLLDTNLLPPRYVLQAHCTTTATNSKDSTNKIHSDGTESNWPEEEDKLVRIIQYGASIAIQEGLIEAEEASHSFLLSGVHTHLRHALKLCRNDSNGIICAVRQFEYINPSDPASNLYIDSSTIDGVSTEDDSSVGLNRLLEDIIMDMDKRNVVYFEVQWCPSGIDPYLPGHAHYLKNFSSRITAKLKELIEEATKNWGPNWELFPSAYRKPVQEVYRESQSHLLNSRRYLRELGVSQSLDSDCDALLHIQKLMLAEDEKLRHTPVIVCGRDGCGKSTLLAQVITYCTEWLGGDVIRIVRHVGQSPCSIYTSELLRNLCLHISLVFDFDPKHQNFELGELSIWFQDLLKMVEATPTDLVIVLDDLHELRSPTGSQSAILGWLPWILPRNVHIICSISEDAEDVLRYLRSRSSDSFVHIPPLGPQAAISMLQSNLRDRKHTLNPNQLQAIKEKLTTTSTCSLYIKLLSKIAEKWHSWMEVTAATIPGTLEEVVDFIFLGIKNRYGFRTMRKVVTFLACTTFGLRENELIELMSSTIESADESSQKQLNRPSTWFNTVKEMKPLLKEYYVDRRPYLHWSHSVISKYIMNKYLKTSRDLKACYSELASAFQLGFLMEKDKFKERDFFLQDENCDITKRKDDWCDILREIDELWYHLLQSGDREKLKQDAICNFEFLQCALSCASVSYVRSILELVKCHILDWEVELLSAVTKQAVDILSQDPSQMATELLNWLKPFADFSATAALKGLVMNALKFCNKPTFPRLVPSNSWLSLTMPPQVISMTTPDVITNMVVTPDGQHALCSSGHKEISMFHLPSRNLVRKFSGHKEAITCLHVTSSGQWLVSGSEDTDVIVWMVDSGQIKHRISHHITGVLCVNTTHSESLLLSGSEIGVVILASLDTGKEQYRLDTHRGHISGIAVNSDDDIFATGSSDKTVCVWSLDNYSLLNTISLSSAICRMDISKDSTFLVLACEDQSLHVRSLTTGSEVHCLQGIASKVTAVCFGHDNCRCIVGSSDGRCHVFDIHSASLITTLTGHTDSVCSVQVLKHDTFLITAGGNRVVVWNFIAPKREINGFIKPKVKRVDSHREPILCLSVSKDGTLAVTGSKDNLLKVWNLTTGEVIQSLSGHTAPITCATFAPNGLFVVSGAEDTTLRVFRLALGLSEVTFKEHQSKILNVCVASDSRRVLSVDFHGHHRLWVIDNGKQLYSIQKSSGQWLNVLVNIHGSMIFAVYDKDLKFWPLMDAENETKVSHSDIILCYAVTSDCDKLITGSKDTVLKVWEIPTGRITQVLAGHEGSVTCVALAPLNSSIAASGSSDCTLNLWDMIVGHVIFTFRGHTDSVRCVELTPDGALLLSGSSDNTIQLWDARTGDRICMVDLHAQFLEICCSFNLNYVVVQLSKSSSVPILRLHNNPAKGITLDMLPGYQENLRSLGPPGALPKRVLQRGNLKREQSFDSLFWELKSSSPRHEFLPSTDDLNRQPFSASGSCVWDGTKGRNVLRPSDSLGMPSKPKLAKNKLLKKQQSMFAIFPDHNQTQQSLAKDMEARKADMLARIQSANRKLDAPSENPGEANGDEGQKGADVIQSTVCVIA